MAQTLSAVPNLKLPGRQSRGNSRRQASRLRGLNLGDFTTDEHISLFPDLNLRIPVGRILIASTVMVLGLLLIGHFAQLGTFLSAFIYDPRNAGISGDPVITGLVDWLPIGLVGLSTVVLAVLVVNRTRYRRKLQQSGPRLVTRKRETPKSSSGLTLVKTDLAQHQDHAQLFLVQKAQKAQQAPENRHEAQEQVRLERDARASALARATAAERLLVSGHVRLHESEELVVPKPRRPLASMPPQAAPQQPLSGVFFPATAAAKPPAPTNIPRLHLSRAPHTPQAIL